MAAMNIPLRGLHCMGCARKVEKALNTDHQVEIHQLTPDAVTLDSDASFRQLAQSIEQVGYHAGHHYELSLSGLHCGNCVNKLKAKLDEQSDIGEYQVSTSELSIDTLLSELQVIELVESAGFSAVSKDSLMYFLFFSPFSLHPTTSFATSITVPLKTSYTSFTLISSPPLSLSLSFLLYSSLTSSLSSFSLANTLLLFSSPLFLQNSHLSLNIIFTTIA